MEHNQKILCPFHQENTPSCHLYPNGFKCFGCGKTGKLSELGIAIPYEIKPRYVENIQEKLAYISSLPRVPQRGLSLPSDDISYYLVWPDGNYYKQRFLDVEKAGRKYKCPSGHSQPLFTARVGVGEPLIIVEGEFNALAIADAINTCDIVSPGSAGDFYSRTSQKNLQFYAKYGKILLIADCDKPGAVACIELKTLLIKAGIKNVKIKLMAEDANDWLVNYGRERLKAEIEKDLDL